MKQCRIYSIAAYKTHEIVPGGGGYSHMKETGMLVVSLRGVHFGFCQGLV